MRDTELSGVVILPKEIRNSRVVREVDPRVSREVVALLLLVAILVGGVALYAWPHLAWRQTGIATEHMARERDRLVEENRKLKLEKASLENLKRIEGIATHQLGLATPAPENVIVIETRPIVPPGARLAERRAGEESARN